MGSAAPRGCGVASAYDPAHDADHNITVDPLGSAFDAIVHTARVRTSELVPESPQISA